MNRTGVLLKKYAGCGIVFGILTIVLLQLTGTAAAAQARGADSSHFTCGGWKVVSSPNPFTLSALSGVAAVSLTDVGR